jgi:hypothetical protein
LILRLSEIYGPYVPPYGRIDTDYGKRLRSPTADGPIYMLNLTRYRPDVTYVRNSAAGATVNSREADGRYAPLGVLAAIGARLCFVADVVASPGNWHRVGVVAYRSRRSFIAMSARRDFQDWHHGKSAGVEEAVVMGTLPTAALPAPSNTSRILLETWNGPEPAAIADGPVCEFAVEGTLLGDGRLWTGVRYTAIEPGTPLPFVSTSSEYDALLLEPTMERWQ